MKGSPVKGPVVVIVGVVVVVPDAAVVVPASSSGVAGASIGGSDGICGVVTLEPGVYSVML